MTYTVAELNDPGFLREQLQARDKEVLFLKHQVLNVNRRLVIIAEALQDLQEGFSSQEKLAAALGLTAKTVLDTISKV